MPVIIWGGIAVAGLLGSGWALREAGDAAEAGAQLAKWGAVAGGVYLAYQASKSAGLIR